MDIITTSEEQTVEAAEKFAEKIENGAVIFLRGNLGAGKSVFARSLIRTLCDDPALDVPSPTFTLVQTYDSQAGSIWHFDLYRLEEAQEVYELGWEEALADGIVIIEWPERLGDLKPAHYLDIHITSIENEPTSRVIQINECE